MPYLQTPTAVSPEVPPHYPVGERKEQGGRGGCVLLHEAPQVPSVLSRCDQSANYLRQIANTQALNESAG